MDVFVSAPTQQLDPEALGLQVLLLLTAAGNTAATIARQLQREPPALGAL